MAKASSTDTSHLAIPEESRLLRAAYEQSGLSVGALSKATGISTTAIHMAMNGFRYRDGQATVTTPPDNTVVKLASVLRVDPDKLQGTGRTRAAELLREASKADIPTTTLSDEGAQAMAAGRLGLSRQVLAVFSTEELRAEIQRRDAEDEASQERGDQADLLDDLSASQYPG